MNNPLRSAETVDLINANRKLELYDAKIKELKAILDVWAFTAQGEVIVKEVPVAGADGPKLSEPVFIVTFKKGNGTGYVREIGREQLVYYAESPQALVEELAEEIFTRFYKDEIKNRVTRLVAQGLKNAAAIEGKV